MLFRWNDWYFNPLSLYRERPGMSSRSDTLRQNFNPLSLYRERLQPPSYCLFWPCISIHSPYTGRDDLRKGIFQSHKYFNPLSLYRERRNVEPVRYAPAEFQSTLPIQGETLRIQPHQVLHLYFNPLSLYRERRNCLMTCVSCFVFQSTLPIQGETMTRLQEKECSIFQSTLPIQGETPEGHRHHHHSLYFNPLSLYRERPTFFWTSYRFLEHFNPLSLYRERRFGGSTSQASQHFNPLSLYRERPLRQARCWE